MPHRTLASCLLFLAVSCRRAELISPADGSVQRAPWVPIVVNVSEALKGAEGRAWLDGEEVTDPLGLVRYRDGYSRLPRDYIGYLSLGGLQPGEHRLQVELTTVVGFVTRVLADFDFAPPPCQVTLSVRDASGAPIRGRVLITDGEQPVDLAGPDAVAADPSGRDIGLHSVLVDGTGEVRLDHGHYRLLASRGIRHSVDAVEFDCTGSDERPTADFTLERVIDTPGWLAADLHVHTAKSSDAFLPNRQRYEAVLSTDLDVVVVTDHNHLTDPAPALALLDGPDGRTRGLPGVEARIGRADPDDPTNELGFGHLNAFPLSPGDLPSTWAEPVGLEVEAYRQRQVERPFEGDAQVIVQLNHPRGIQFFPDEEPDWGAHALFSWVGYDRGQPVDAPKNAWLIEPAPGGTAGLEMDALEVLNRFSLDVYRQVRADWFALLDQGWVLTGTGNSDSHAFEVEQIGYPVNLVRCTGPAPGEPLDAAAFVDAIADGQVTVSTGPVVSVAAVGADGGRVGPGGTVTTRGGRAVVEVRVQAAPWVPVDEVRLVVGGRMAERMAITPDARSEDGVLDLRITWDVRAEADSWLLAEAGIASSAAMPTDPLAEFGDYALIAAGHAPIGFTNPVFIDADRDGVWAPPGL